MTTPKPPTMTDINLPYRGAPKFKKGDRVSYTIDGTTYVGIVTSHDTDKETGITTTTIDQPA